MTLLRLLPVGPYGRKQAMADRRTLAQRQAVLDLIERPDFKYLVTNPFQDNVNPSYTGPFNVQWIDTSFNLHIYRIGKNGNILNER